MSLFRRRPEFVERRLPENAELRRQHDAKQEVVLGLADVHRRRDAVDDRLVDQERIADILYRRPA